MDSRREDAAYTELDPDTWHQNDEGNYYIDCPECGSAATLMNVVQHGRCNGYLDQREGETELDEEAMDCTARLWFELGYVSDPESTDEETASDDTTADDGEPNADGTTETGVETDEGVPAEGEPPGADGTVDEQQEN
ncbi:hypothetical protein C482_04009 [Natrialba chahannaoensis JCM 10990]|uniref:Uncharacterized protein n=1 Tax=Natrialba chahannaoensis JCM 10990 TaxID=1227492 RepID=M0B0D9_9EURY|nr:hypothetical protein [Natrialba chahannaoensis]ELZ03154.1 hypothetical protein C482_04009 [Natrialba chahannaoensis JCM 10990]